VSLDVFPSMDRPCIKKRYTLSFKNLRSSKGHAKNEMIKYNNNNKRSKAIFDTSQTKVRRDKIPGIYFSYPRFRGVTKAVAIVTLHSTFATQNEEVWKFRIIVWRKGCRPIWDCFVQQRRAVFQKSEIKACLKGCLIAKHRHFQSLKLTKLTAEMVLMVG